MAGDFLFRNKKTYLKIFKINNKIETISNIEPIVIAISAILNIAKLINFKYIKSLTYEKINLSIKFAIDFFLSIPSAVDKYRKKADYINTAIYYC